MPGVRRGYAILPYQARSGESEAQLQEIRGAITRAREASVQTGAVGSMEKKRLWVNFSTSPEKRRRNVLVGKLKRAIPEAGGIKSSIEAEFATGSVPGTPCIGGGPHHEACTSVGCGWVKENARTDMLGPKFMQAWTPLGGWSADQIGPVMHGPDHKLNNSRMEDFHFVSWNRGKGG